MYVRSDEIKVYAVGYWYCLCWRSHVVE